MLFMRPVKENKYKAKPTVVDGIRFHSKKEANRYRELRLLERAGEIRDLQLQYPYELSVPRYGSSVKKQAIGKYLADFRYRSGKQGILVVEDVKGMDTPLSKWKRRHVLAQYGIEVQLV